ncbi:MAG: hypothetical protein IT162_05130 [Bryobacterales bacterium]|nr:hypothetical protein [Bryobacterales bacterium]
MPINYVSGSASFLDSLTMAGSGGGFVRYRFVGNLTAANQAFLAFGAQATFGGRSISANVSALTTFSEDVDYWTDGTAFIFGTPVDVSEMLSFSIGGVQETGTLSAFLRLLEIAVYDDQRVFLGPVSSTSESGTIYTSATLAPALVPEPATGGLALLALFGVIASHTRNSLRAPRRQ